MHKANAFNVWAYKGGVCVDSEDGRIVVPAPTKNIPKLMRALGRVYALGRKHAYAPKRVESSTQMIMDELYAR